MDDYAADEVAAAPLLVRQQESLQLDIVGPGPGSESDAVPDALSREVLRIIRLAGPLALQDILILLQSTVIIAFVGRLDALSLSAMVLCITTFNVTGLSLTMGAASGAETLSGQCFGARKYGALGTILQRSLLITWLVICGILLLWTKVGAILTATGQSPVLVGLAVKQLWLCTPALIATGTTECLKRYLMAQGIVVPTCLVYVVFTLLSPLIAWAAIFGFGMGLSGAAIAYDILTVLCCASLMAYTALLNRRLAGSGRETWRGWSRDAVKRWGEYLSLAIPGTLMLCLEWWTWEALTLMTGELAEAEINVGVMGILFQIGSICYMLPIGLQGAASTRVSNELGNGNPAGAKRAFQVAMAIGLLSQSTIAVVLFLGRAVWARAFSSEAEIVARVAGIIPIMALIAPSDGMSAVCSGVVRGCGRQALAATLNIFTFWGIGLPLAAALAFKGGLGIKGLWIGLGLVTYIQLFAIATLICRLNWRKESVRAAALTCNNEPIGAGKEVADRAASEP